MAVTTVSQVWSMIYVTAMVMLGIACSGVVLVTTQAFRNRPSTPLLVTGFALICVPVLVYMFVVWNQKRNVWNRERRNRNASSAQP